MKLHVNFDKAVEEYRAYVEDLVANGWKGDKNQLLTLEVFACWLQEKWPKYAEART